MADRNGPALWDAIMAVVGTHWQPVVAGGAVRDFYLRQEPKDIDVFVPATCTEDFTSIIDSMDVSLAHGTIISNFANPSAVSEYEAGEANEVFGVWEGEIIGVPVNIVGRKSLGYGPVSLVETFDFGINQVAYDTDGQVQSSVLYEHDIAAKTFTLWHNRTYAQSLERFDRINERHGDAYRLVDPFITEL